MYIFIPQHLQKIGVIKQALEMVRGYSKYYENPSDSFDDYNYCLKLDPVKRFLSMCIPASEFEKEHPGQDYDSVILYLSHLFYSVKGTLKVFEYMRAYLGLEFDGDILYTTRYIEFTIVNLSVTDETIFYESLRDFLDALLYFEEFKTNAKAISLTIADTVSNKISAGCIPYHHTSAEIIDSL